LLSSFYNADGTTGCSLEAQRFQQALPAFASADAQVIGVSMDNLSKHSALPGSHGMSRADAPPSRILHGQEAHISSPLGRDRRGLEELWG
jgi:hypothetical protein